MRFILVLLAGLCLFGGEPLRFRVKLSPEVAPQGSSGRLFVFLDKGDAAVEEIKVGFLPGSVWMAAKEVGHWRAGATVEINPDEMAYPLPFSQAPKGDYVVMALLDPNHSFARNRRDAGDLVSRVKVLNGVDPASAGTVELELNAVTPKTAEKADTANVKAIHFESPALTAFMGRPVMMHAGVIVPKGHTAQSAPLPAIYHIHGFGGDYTEAWAKEEQYVAEMETGERLKAVHVFLDGNCPGGHHAFVDSVNNGPWGRALTTELIPYLEGRFRTLPAARGRFLTGHSSGGWTSLWLQVRYADFFGGTWPTSPDPVDFRSFTGIDVTAESAQNAYLTREGRPLNLVRMGGKETMTVEEFARMEEVTGEFGGQLASFEWAFSPRGEDGRPLPLFNRLTGELSRDVRQYWQRYDIARVLREKWEMLGPKLRGKIRLAIGAEDNFHLNESAAMLCEWMRGKGREDACEIVPGRDHFDLHRPYTTYPRGLYRRIDAEMRALWERGGR